MSEENGSEEQQGLAYRRRCEPLVYASGTGWIGLSERLEFAECKKSLDFLNWPGHKR